MVLSELFWTTLYTFAGGFLLACAGVFYRSKCDRVSLCWGCISINRNVEIELAEDRLRPPPSTTIPIRRSSSQNENTPAMQNTSMRAAQPLSDIESQSTPNDMTLNIKHPGIELVRR
jgi:hypothetical protein